MHPILERGCLGRGTFAPPNWKGDGCIKIPRGTMILFVPSDLYSLHFFTLIWYTSEESLAPSLLVAFTFCLDRFKLFEPLTSWIPWSEKVKKQHEEINTLLGLLEAYPSLFRPMFLLPDDQPSSVFSRVWLSASFLRPRDARLAASRQKDCIW